MARSPSPAYSSASSQPSLRVDSSSLSKPPLSSSIATAPSSYYGSPSTSTDALYLSPLTASASIRRRPLPSVPAIRASDRTHPNLPRPSPPHLPPAPSTPPQVEVLNLAPSPDEPVGPFPMSPLSAQHSDFDSVTGENVPLYEAEEGVPPPLPEKERPLASAAVAMPLPSAPPLRQEDKDLEIEAWRRAQADAGTSRADEFPLRDESDRSDRSGGSRRRRGRAGSTGTEGLSMAEIAAHHFRLAQQHLQEAQRLTLQAAMGSSRQSSYESDEFGSLPGPSSMSLGSLERGRQNSHERRGSQSSYGDNSPNVAFGSLPHSLPQGSSSFPLAQPQSFSSFSGSSYPVSDPTSRHRLPKRTHIYSSSNLPPISQGHVPETPPRPPPRQKADFSPTRPSEPSSYPVPTLYAGSLPRTATIPFSTSTESSQSMVNNFAKRNILDEATLMSPVEMEPSASSVLPADEEEFHGFRPRLGGLARRQSTSLPSFHYNHPLPRLPDPPPRSSPSRLAIHDQPLQYDHSTAFSGTTRPPPPPGASPPAPSQLTPSRPPSNPLIHQSSIAGPSAPRSLPAFPTSSPPQPLKSRSRAASITFEANAASLPGGVEVFGQSLPPQPNWANPLVPLVHRPESVASTSGLSFRKRLRLKSLREQVKGPHVRFMSPPPEQHALLRGSGSSQSESSRSQAEDEAKRDAAVQAIEESFKILM